MELCQSISEKQQQPLGESSQNEKQQPVEKMGNWEVAPRNQQRGNRFQNLEGLRFGRLIAVALSNENTSKGCRWICKCDCGSIALAASSSLSGGSTKSCGCLRKEHSANMVREMNTTHGDARHGKISTEHKAWTSMRQRCYSPNHKYYHRYGGRGIKICERWSSFENFLADMGRKPSPELSLDRIRNNGDYEPGNCRWGTYEQQQNNRSSNRVFELNGTSKTLKQWSVQFGINPVTVSDRIKRGWTFERAITQPVKLSRTNETAAELRALRFDHLNNSSR